MTKYTVNQNDFHGGWLISSHRSLKAALTSVHAHSCTECKCGGPSLEMDGDSFHAPVIALDYYHDYEGRPLREAIDLASRNWTPFEN